MISSFFVLLRILEWRRLHQSFKQRLLAVRTLNYFLDQVNSLSRVKEKSLIYFLRLKPFNFLSFLSFKGITKCLDFDYFIIRFDLVYILTVKRYHKFLTHLSLLELEEGQEAETTIKPSNFKHLLSFHYLVSNYCFLISAEKILALNRHYLHRLALVHE